MILTILKTEYFHDFGKRPPTSSLPSIDLHNHPISLLTQGEEDLSEGRIDHKGAKVPALQEVDFTLVPCIA